MKSFLEEYGFTILAAIVVILIIAMCTPIGNLIKEQVLGVVNSFAAKTEGKLAAIDADAPVKVVLKQSGNGTGKNASGADSPADKPGLFAVTATSSSQNDTFKVEYRVKDQNGNWGTYTALGSATLSTSTYDHAGTFTAKIQNGNQIQVRVYDDKEDANVFYESNIVTYTGNTQDTAADLA